MPTTIHQSNNDTATAYSNQRNIDRCQNGVLWTVWSGSQLLASDALTLWHSTDDGASWGYSGSIAFAGTGTTYIINASLFIDIDDYAHLVYKDRHDGFIYYRRGTPNADRTAWTWSAAHVLGTNTALNYPDIIAHREGTGWKAHIVMSYTGASDGVTYARVGIDSAGTISVEAGGSGAAVSISGTYGNTNHKWPSIDFNHTGDGKTVAGGTPHLYVAWSAGTWDVGNGIRFKKATYSGGAWTWGTEQELSTSYHILHEENHWLNCVFTGTYVLVGGYLKYSTDMMSSTTWYNLIIWEIDPPTSAVNRSKLIMQGDSAKALEHTSAGSLSYDSYGDVYFVGADSISPDAASNLVIRKCLAVNNYNLESTTTIDTSARVSPFVSVKRGYSERFIEFVYTDNAAAPFDVRHHSLYINKPPNAPTLVAPLEGELMDVTKDIRLAWQHNDPDGDPQTEYALKLTSTAWVGEKWWNESAATPYDKMIINSNPIGYWRLEETAGTVAADSSGNGNDGSYIGAYTLNIASPLVNIPSNAINLAGGSVEVPHNISLRTAGNLPYSMGVWYRGTVLSGSLLSVAYRGDLDNRGADLWLQSGTLGAHLISTWSTDALKVVSNKVVNDGVWHFCVVTYDGSKSAEGLRLYVDGVEPPKNLDVNSLTSDITYNDGSPFRIGGRTTGVDHTASSTVSGDYDEPFFINRELSAMEIARQYRSGIYTHLTDNELWTPSYNSETIIPAGTLGPETEFIWSAATGS